MAKDDIHNMVGLDVYLSSLSDEQYSKIKDYLHQAPVRSVPLQSWDITGHAHAQLLANATKLADGFKLREFSKKYGWKTATPELQYQQYEAVIVTDVNLTIQWVSPGFVSMTGYPAKFAIGQTPKFLQGKNTLDATRAHIRQQLQSGQPFEAVITNYRKNSEEYVCEVKIYPMMGKDGQTSHFIALERETA